MTALTATLRDMRWTLPLPAAYGPAAKILESAEKETLQGPCRPPQPPFDMLPDAIARDVSLRWPGVCEAVFDFLACQSPDGLAILIKRAELDSADLTFAAEALGHTENGALVRDTLLPLLEHGSPVVREGAIYGLQQHLNDAVRQRLREISVRDPSPGVRTAAEDALDES